jgi:hypothetical protein
MKATDLRQFDHAAELQPKSRPGLGASPTKGRWHRERW